MTALETAKATFSSVTGVLLIRGEPAAQKLLIAWTIYRPAFRDSSLLKGEDASSALDRLWEEVGPIHFKRLGEIAGMPETKAEKMFRRLRAARLLWPDGTVAANAMNVLIGEGNAYLRGLLPRTAPPAAAPKPAEKPKAKK